MAQEVRAHAEAGPITQGLADMAQSWARLAGELVPQVPELPGLIEQVVSALDGREITEETLNAAARSISAKVEEAGFSDEGALLLRRMGRAMYELLLVIATQEELRAMGMLLSVTPGGAPTSRANGKTPPAGAAAVGAAPPPKAAPAPSPGPGPAAPPATSRQVAAAPDAPAPAQSKPPAPSTSTAPGSGGAAPDPGAGRPAAPAPRGPRVPVVVPPVPQKPAAAPGPASPPAVSAGAAAPAARAPMPAVDEVAPTAPPPKPDGGGRPAPAASPAPAPAPRRPAESPAVVPRSQSEVVESALWGFDPSARENDADEGPPADDPQPTEAAIVVEATAAAPAPAPEAVLAPVAGPTVGAWRVRLSPRMAEARERKVGARRAEFRPLVDEVIQQVHEQRRAVSDRGPARQAVHASSDIGAPADLGLASAQLDDLLEAGQLERAAALALRVTEAFPGESSAELACRAGEASRDSKQEDLAILCLTTAVLAAPPFEQACWQLAGMAVERRDPKLAPIWLELVARLLRVRGADEDAVVVYRQLINICPRREDVREVLRVASLTGSLPD